SMLCVVDLLFFFSSRRRHTRSKRDWSSDVCSSDLVAAVSAGAMYTLMYLAAFPIASNPLYDTHLLLAVAMIAMAGLAAGDHVGLGRQWSRLVKGNRFLI